jgi:hypothetical protein
MALTVMQDSNRTLLICRKIPANEKDLIFLHTTHGLFGRCQFHKSIPDSNLKIYSFSRSEIHYSKYFKLLPFKEIITLKIYWES